MKIFDGKMKALLHGYFLGMKGREVIFIMKSIVHHEYSKGMG